MQSTARPCDDCAHVQRCKQELLACQAFIFWTDTGINQAALARDPGRQSFVDLSQFDCGLTRYRAARRRDARERRAERLAELQRQARREAFEHKRKVAAGLAQPLSKAERRQIHLARRRRRWAIDAELRERYLQSKREDAIRRGRRNGSAPKGSEAAIAHRSEGQRRRWQAEHERAATEGLLLSPSQLVALRQTLGMTQATLGATIGKTRAAIKNYEGGRAAVPAAVARSLQALAGERLERSAPCEERTPMQRAMDPASRTALLAAKRRDAIRRARQRGVAAAGSAEDRAHRRAGQLRRSQAVGARAAAEGLVMTAEQVRKLRADLGMTQDVLGAAIGKTRGAIKNYESGARGAPAAIVAKLRALLREAETKSTTPGSLRASPTAAVQSGHRALTAYPGPG